MATVSRLSLLFAALCLAAGASFGASASGVTLRLHDSTLADAAARRPAVRRLPHPRVGRAPGGTARRRGGARREGHGRGQPGERAGRTLPGPAPPDDLPRAADRATSPAARRSPGAAARVARRGP